VITAFGHHMVSDNVDAGDVTLVVKAEENTFCHDLREYL
jgi:hypothetical protein